MANHRGASSLVGSGARLSLLVIALAGAPAFAQAGQRAEKSDVEVKELSPSVIFGRAARSTVVVDLGEARLGSGVVVGHEEVVTNHHVIEGGGKIVVRQGGESWPATVTASDKERDIALLSVPGLKRPRVRIRDSATLKVGERVYAIGTPTGLELSLSDGLVSALRPKIDAHEIQTTAPISPGSSGGGLYDAQGRLVGITTWFRTGGQNLNFAHPTEWIGWVRKNRTGTAVAAATVQSANAAGTFTASARPHQLRCRMSVRAMVGLFSSGLEVLESVPISEEWTIDDFHRQVPVHSKSEPSTPHARQLVLVDLDRNAQYASFGSTTSSRIEYRIFFNEDSIVLVQSEATAVYGQPRLFVATGECEGLTATQLQAEAEVRLREAARLEAEAAAFRKTHGSPEVLCDKGDAEYCIVAAKNRLRGRAGERNEPEALIYFRRACDLRNETGCIEAARLYRTVGMEAKAREFTQKACALGSRDHCSR